jgi:hypothetical protein
MLSQISVSNEISKRLGDEGLSQVCSNLWAMDCQTCGHSLGDKVPSLCVDYITATGDGAVATLHHQTCRPSAWANEPQIGPGALTTYLTRCCLLPDELCGGTSDEAKRLGSARPTFILNTSAEMIAIERVGTGQWQLLTYTHRYLGMRHLGPEYVIGRAITAGFATLQPNAVTAHLADQAWPAPIEPWLAECIKRYQGITLCITSALGPGSLKTEFDMRKLIVDGQLELGWLALR